MSNEVSVMLSIRSPGLTAKILNGKKTVEALGTRPNLLIPFRVYIYIPKYYESGYTTDLLIKKRGKYKSISLCEYSEASGEVLNGKVIGEFVCDKIYRLNWIEDDDEYPEKEFLDALVEFIGCSPGALFEYRHRLNFPFYGWHISELKIYDNPKDLSDFNKTYSPRSWCYIKKLGDYDNE